MGDDISWLIVEKRRKSHRNLVGDRLISRGVPIFLSPACLLPRVTKSSFVLDNSNFHARILSEKLHKGLSMLAHTNLLVMRLVMTDVVPSVFLIGALLTMLHASHRVSISMATI